jgi:hypothetical protein
MDDSVYDEIERLEHLCTVELRERYRKVFGEENRTQHKQHRVRGIAWRLQVLAQVARHRSSRSVPLRQPLVPVQHQMAVNRYNGGPANGLGVDSRTDSAVPQPSCEPYMISHTARRAFLYASPA